MDDLIEADILKSEFGGLYFLGKTLLMVAQLPRDQRAIALDRLNTLCRAFGISVTGK